METYTTHDLDDAIEFVRYLRRWEPHWLDDGDYNVYWMFRGQSDAEHSLLPSAWRPQMVNDEMYKVAERKTTDAIVS